MNFGQPPLDNRLLRANAEHDRGLALAMQGRLEEAAFAFLHVLQLQPNHAQAHSNLGNVRRHQGHLHEAMTHFAEAVRLKPDFAEAHNNLGTAWAELGDMDAAVGSFRQAIRLRPDYAEAHNNLGIMLRQQGRLGATDEAMEHFRSAVRFKPRDSTFHSSLLATMLYHPHFDNQAILDEHRRWQIQHARSLAPAVPRFGNDPSPRRRLRIGYVSPDFRDHVVGRNLWPLLSHHDHKQFEITLYANSIQTDRVTEQLRGCADHWRGIIGWPDQQVAETIRQDGIDILVDLALHTLGNRLLVLARKPAPVQVTFGGYPGTTGLTTVDYRLTDPYLDPPGLNDKWYTEESYRLPHSFVCHDPQSEEPAVAPLPALANGFITFGCLSRFSKVNDGVLQLWSRVLGAVKGSRLLLQTHEGSHRQRTRDFLEQCGIAAERIDFVSPQPRLDYLRLYHQLDIGLDTLPYNGHATSLDSCWMGVPVVTLVGKTVVGRAGLSLLSNLGLSELAAFDADQFVGVAVELAGDLRRLQGLRSGLRERLRQSPLLDAGGYARGVEEAYRAMWERWCKKDVPLKVKSRLP